MSDYFNGIDFMAGYQQRSPLRDQWDMEPDYDEYLDECDWYADALDLDMEIAQAALEDRLEWFES